VASSITIADDGLTGLRLEAIVLDSTVAYKIDVDDRISFSKDALKVFHDGEELEVWKAVLITVKTTTCSMQPQHDVCVCR
jgi:hypothetical protein